MLSYIQVIVDEFPNKKGMFILTGNHQLELHQAVSQSLAGRTAILPKSSLTNLRKTQQIGDSKINGQKVPIYQIKVVSQTSIPGSNTKE